MTRLPDAPDNEPVIGPTRLSEFCGHHCGHHDGITGHCQCWECHRRFQPLGVFDEFLTPTPWAVAPPSQFGKHVRADTGDTGTDVTRTGDR